MAKRLLSLFDGLMIALSVLVIIIFVTGGQVFQSSFGKLEVSSLDPWILVIVVLALVRGRWGDGPVKERFIALVRWMQRPRVSEKGFHIFLWSVFGLLFLAHVLKHWSLSTHSFDMTLIHQPLFHPLGPPLLRCDPCFRGTYFGEHQAWTFFLIAPLVSWLRSDEVVFAIQALLFAVPLWLGFKYGPLRNLKSYWWVGVLILLCCRTMRQDMTWDFREDNLAFAFLIGTCICLYRGWLLPYAGFLSLALLSKENVGFVTLLLVAPIWLDRSLPLSKRDRWMFTGVTLILSLAWILVLFTYLMPKVAKGQEYHQNISLRLPHLGSSPRAVVLTALTQPWKVLAIVWKIAFSKAGIKYLVTLLGPFVIFLRRGWPWALPALVGITMNLLFGSTQINLEFHYQLIVIPFLFMAAWVAMSRWDKTPRAWVAPLVLALMFSARWPGFEIRKYFPSKEQVQQHFFLRNLPTDENRVTAGHWVLAQVSRFPKLGTLLYPPSVPGPAESTWKSMEQLNGWKSGERVIVDRKQTETPEYKAWVEFFEVESVKRGWRSEGSDLGERFAIYRKI